mmetsp:Transcript_5014/g.7563  ORF Transcript_5014/g.7563 Transcript_5014/m.7563 type:complete len:745 (+) Transcript_5014:32-2266(+)
MGCGGSKNQASQPSKSSAAPAAQAAGASSSAPKASAQTNINVSSAEDQWEDEQFMIDEDLERETNGYKYDKKGNKVSQYDRDEKRPEDNAGMVGLFEVESAGAGDQIMATKPWIGAIKPPTNPPEIKNSPPAVSLELEYVYGYRCFDSRQNVFYTSDPNKIVYMTAALGVVLDKKNNTQRFFGAGDAKRANGHSDDVTALAIHPNKDLVVTGEVGANPKVCVWSASNPEAGPKSEFRLGRGRRAVSCAGFSHDGNQIAVADLHNDHYVSVWDTNSGRKIGENKGGPDRILDLCWSKTEARFVTAGIKHIYFWAIENGSLTKDKGIYMGKGPMCSMTSAQWLSDGTCITGGTNGMLYQWKGRELQRAEQVLPKGTGVHALTIVEDTILLGGRNDSVTVLDKNFKKIKEIPTKSCPRAIDMNGQNVVVGTRDGQIREFPASGQPSVLMQSHADGEVWGLAVDKSDNIIVTVGDDNYVKVWDVKQRKCVKSAILDPNKGEERKAGYGASTLASTSPNQQGRALCINPSNGHIAIGLNDGKVIIKQSIDNLESTVNNFKIAKEWIEAMQYSPDGSKLAVGSHDNAVYVFDVAGGYKLLHKLNKHSSFITALDWSVDGSAIHTTCGAYELLFWDVSNGQQVTDGATRYADEEWATWSTPLGWPVQGIFGGVIDYTHINSVDRSRSGDKCAIGNDWGLVEIFGYPNSEGAKSKAYRGHSEHVMNVKWNGKDSCVFSAGGYDQTIMQWKAI